MMIYFEIDGIEYRACVFATVPDEGDSVMFKAPNGQVFHLTAPVAVSE